ncbi:hypothetical protein ASG52_25205 [Methylobacterium sp. Leaf456]|uniref:DUF4357 domain-containing protein n=1 Tax=Methylobacterium sp. Leaf456 TaxID=1736382 RepID=UPI0006FFBC34|nr:DUF4357 domain-containing protein [Methylobacterium sp. Leaf456]KQT55026.1 hypothetical protein ASG52_25205 [Methylobacterium sp. Leaf456]
MAAGRVTGRLIKLFITGDDPRSLRTVELDNWWGMAVMGRRSYFEKALAREELSRSCIDLLIRSSGSDDLPEVYVGESDDFVARYKNSPFPIAFDSFIIFTNKDDNLTRAHVKWLEREVWDLLTRNEGKVQLANRATPTGSKLPEAETASMGTFLGNMIYVLEALGFAFFEDPGQFAAPVQPASVAPHQASAQSFVTSAQPRSDGHKAYLDMIGDGYVLRADSLINANPTDSLPANVRKLRAQLVAENALVPQDGCLRLTKDIAFTSPSPAFALVKGRSSAGHGDWIRTTDRKRLGDVLLEPREQAEGAG